MNYVLYIGKCVVFTAIARHDTVLFQGECGAQLEGDGVWLSEETVFYGFVSVSR